jgi:hypothetical protein
VLGVGHDEATEPKTRLKNSTRPALPELSIRLACHRHPSAAPVRIVVGLGISTDDARRAMGIRDVTLAPAWHGAALATF